MSCPEDAMTDLLFDPQTSGGLLIAMAEDKAATLFPNLRRNFIFKPTSLVMSYHVKMWTSK